MRNESAEVVLWKGDRMSLRVPFCVSLGRVYRVMRRGSACGVGVLLAGALCAGAAYAADAPSAADEVPVEPAPVAIPPTGVVDPRTLSEEEIEAAIERVEMDLKLLGDDETRMREQVARRGHQYTRLIRNLEETDPDIGELRREIDVLRRELSEKQRRLDALLAQSEKYQKWTEAQRESQDALLETPQRRMQLLGERVRLKRLLEGIRSGRFSSEAPPRFGPTPGLAPDATDEVTSVEESDESP